MADSPNLQAATKADVSLHKTNVNLHLDEYRHDMSETLPAIPFWQTTITIQDLYYGGVPNSLGHQFCYGNLNTFLEDAGSSCRKRAWDRAASIRHLVYRVSIGGKHYILRPGAYMTEVGSPSDLETISSSP